MKEARIEVKNHDQAWAVVDEIFPTDYMKDEEASERAGYPTYRSTVEYYDYVCDLNDRLEINLKDGRTINVWIVDEGKDEKIAELEAENEQLKKALDKELEWKDDEKAGTQMSEERYEKLEKSGKVLTDDEAKELIASEFGFDVKKITIVHEVNTYEVNRHNMMRVKESFDRYPVFEACDWNYIRFDCASRYYEMINDELVQYEC